MSTTMMMDRSGLAMPGMPMSGTGGMMGSSVPAPASTNMMMVPRCTMTFSKCPGGMKVMCVCDDKVFRRHASESLHHDGRRFCAVAAGVMNGMMVCCCNLTMECASSRRPKTEFA